MERIRKNPALIIALVGALAVVNELGFIAKSTVNPNSPILFGFFDAMLVAQMTLIGMWWAIGLASYWWRLLGTALFIGVWTLVTFTQNAGDSGKYFQFITVKTMLPVVSCGGVFFVHRLCGMRRYHLLDSPPVEAAQPPLQFTLTNLLQFITTVAVFASYFEACREIIAQDYKSSSLFLMTAWFLATGFFTLVGAAALLVMLTPRIAALKIVGFFVVLFLVEFGAMLLLLRGQTDNLGDWLMIGMEEGAILVGSLAVVRAYGFRVTWRKHYPSIAPSNKLPNHSTNSKEVSESTTY